MGRDTVQLETAVSTISQEYLLEFTSEYGISEGLHPELPGRGDMVVDFPERKVNRHSKCVIRNPLSLFLKNNLVIVSEFVRSFSVFLFPLFNSGWMSFSKRPGKEYPAVFTKPLDSLKNWNNRFFCVDEKVFPTVVDWRISAPKDGMPVEGTYSVEDVALLNTRQTPIQRQPELLLCLVGLSRRFLEMMCIPRFYTTTAGCPNPAAVKTETRPQVAHEVPLLNTTASRVIDMEDVVATSTSSGTPSAMEKSPLDFDKRESKLDTEVVPEVNLEKDVTVMGALVNKRRRKRDTSEMETNATPKVLRTDHASVRHESMIRGGKSLAAMGVGADIPSPMPAQQTTIAGDPDSEKSSSFTSFAGSPGGIYQLGRGITNSCHLDTPGACQVAVDHMVPPGYFSELGHLPNEEFLNQYNVNLARQVAMGSKLRLRFEQEVRLLKKAKEKVVDTEVQGLRNQTRNLETPLEAEVDMKNAAEANSAELTKELESLRAKFSDLQVNNNQLSQQVSTLQAQVTGKEQIKTTFEEFKKREDDKVERRCAEMDARLDEMSIDFNEELVMWGGEYPQWIRELRPSSSQLKIPMYPEVRDPRDPWAFKEEMMLEDAIMANVSRAEKNKKCRVVCRTHRIGSAHHPKSDGIPVFVPTVAPQGLVILLTDAATQTGV
ncbi:hypothetical protein Tco_0617720 [Tanacetum coccineum]